MAGILLLGRAVFEKIPHNLLPFSSRANRAYRYADALVAVSQTYLDRAKEANPNVPGEVVYIGADFPKLDAAPAKDFGDSKTRFSTWVRSVTAMTWKPCAKAFGNFWTTAKM